MAKPGRKVVFYEHHNVLVAVRKRLKGKHREYCLCHICERFVPMNREKNCEIANQLYALDVRCGVTTPVWECPIFSPDLKPKE